MTAAGTALLPATRWMLAAVASGAATAATAATARSLATEALGGMGTAALMSGALGLVAVAAAVLCLYLLVVSVLAALSHAGRHHGIGRSSLQLLRRIAPAAARRVALGMATASAVTGLALAPALAADSDAPACTASMMRAPDTACSSGDEVPLEVLRAADETPWETGHGTTATSQTELPVPAPTERDRASGDPSTPPPLGWTAAPPQDDSPRTVVVRPGDTLWSITDDVLGPGTDDASRIQQGWPQLHERNLGVIGSDPHTIRPGQVLVIPSDLGSEDTMTSTHEE